jgi:hypothetical protein
MVERINSHLVMQEVGDPQESLLPTSICHPVKTGLLSPGPPWWAAQSTLPWVQAGGQPAWQGTVAQSPPPPSLRAPGPESTELAILPGPSCVQDPDSRPFSLRVSPGDTTRVLTTSACSPHLRPPRHRPAPGEVLHRRLRRPATRSLPGRRLPAGPPPPRRPGEASPTWQGTVSKFPSASPRERHPGSSQQEPSLAPPQAALTCRGTQAGLSYAKIQARSLRSCRH